MNNERVSYEGILCVKVLQRVGLNGLNSTTEYNTVQWSAMQYTEVQQSIKEYKGSNYRPKSLHRSSRSEAKCHLETRRSKLTF